MEFRWMSRKVIARSLKNFYSGSESSQKNKIFFLKIFSSKRPLGHEKHSFVNSAKCFPQNGKNVSIRGHKHLSFCVFISKKFTEIVSLDRLNANSTKMMKQFAKNCKVSAQKLKIIRKKK